jgi:hypothetical protein
MLGYTPADITQIHGTTDCQSGVLESQFIPQGSQQRWVQESALQLIDFQPHVQAHQPMVQQAGWPMVQELQQTIPVAQPQKPEIYQSQAMDEQLVIQ